ncbi:serine/threonine-protein kinase [Nocardioides sp. GXZ039]|uniref:serine/threonine-protein kinase n=1 Tax=Nocardioides sp. GXZ039 TaxID=3136018 RepID=UPI0030F483A5
MARFPSVGEDFGAYRITRQLGRGGMGVVFAAEQRGLGRTVALKVLSPEFAEQSDYRARFSREATVLARLDSPHVIQVFDHGEHDGCLFIATQFVGGGDLSHAIRSSGPLPAARAARIAEQVAWALHDSHAAGVIHRDLKPSNVLLREQSAETFAYLCDFGIAQDRAPGLTAPGSVAGTFAYLAPERLRGQPATAAADVYALGCVLWTMVLGKAPYAGSDVEIGMAHLNEPVPELVEDSAVAVATNRILRKALAKDPAQRYADAGAMRTDLQQLATLAGSTSHPPLRPRTSAPAPDLTKRTGALAASAGVGSGSGGSGGGGGGWGEAPPSSPSHPSGAGYPLGGTGTPIGPPPSGPPGGSSGPFGGPPSGPPPGAPFGAPPSGGGGDPKKRRTAIIVAAVAAVVLAIGGGVTAAVLASGSDDDKAGEESSTSITDSTTSEPTSPTTTTTSTAPVPPTTSSPAAPPPSDPPSRRPEPEPFYPDVPPSTGIKIELGQASLRAPQGWGRIDAGIVQGGVGARDYSDYEGYYSSVFIRRSEPVIPITSIDLLKVAAEAAVKNLDENDDTIELRYSKLMPTAWLDGQRAVRIRASYYSTKDNLSFTEETWFAQRGKWLYRVTFQHSRSDSQEDRRGQIDPMVVSFRWS